MSTLRHSIVAAAVLAAAFLAFACTAGGPRAGGPDPSLDPCCAEDGGSETGTPAVHSNGGERHDHAPAAAEADFSVEGMFVDVCSCRPPCPCEVTEVAAGCVGVGAHQISRGEYAGDDLVGVKIAHAKVVGQWVNLYIDVEDEVQRAAAERFGRAVFAKFGPIHEVKAAEIEVSGADGAYVVTVNGGKTMKLETEPVLGGDGKTAVGYTNIKNAVNPTVFQGRCVSATFLDGDKRVTVAKGRNSHFNAKLKSRGKI